MAGWSPAQDEYLTTHWNAGDTAAKVAEGLEAAFGGEFTRDRVIGRIRRLGLVRKGRVEPPKRAKQPVRRPPSVWDKPGALDRLAALWIEGVPVRKMATLLTIEMAMPVSSNAVIGKVHRQGLAVSHPRESSSSGEENEAKRVRGLLIAREKAAKRERRAAKQLPPSAALALADVTNARPWLTREPGECAFPLGERGEVMSCCAPTEETYCPAHRQAMGGYRKPWVSTDHIRMARAA